MESYELHVHRYMGALSLLVIPGGANRRGVPVQVTTTRNEATGWIMLYVWFNVTDYTYSCRWCESLADAERLAWRVADAIGCGRDLEKEFPELQKREENADATGVDEPRDTASEPSVADVQGSAATGAAGSDDLPGGGGAG